MPMMQALCTVTLYTRPIVHLKLKLDRTPRHAPAAGLQAVNMHVHLQCHNSTVTTGRAATADMTCDIVDLET
jgi:hypothetical protein